MFEKGESSNKRKMNGCYFQHNLPQTLSLFLYWHRKIVYYGAIWTNVEHKLKFDKIKKTRPEKKNYISGN